MFLAIALVLAGFRIAATLARLASVPGASLAGAMVGSRLILAVHWPSNVLAGLALRVGVCLAVTMTAAFFDHDRTLMLVEIAGADLSFAAISSTGQTVDRGAFTRS